MKLEYLEKDEVWGKAPYRPDLVAQIVHGHRGRRLLSDGPV